MGGHPVDVFQPSTQSRSDWYRPSYYTHGKNTFYHPFFLAAHYDHRLVCVFYFLYDIKRKKDRHIDSLSRNLKMGTSPINLESFKFYWQD